MRGLCRELGLSFIAETKELLTPAAYSDKIGDLLKRKRAYAADQQVSACIIA